MIKKELMKRITEGTATNDMLGIHLGTEIKEDIFGNKYIAQKHGPALHVPDWLGDTDDALSLVPEGWHETLFRVCNGEHFRKFQACLVYQRSYKKSITAIHKSLPTAIVLAVLEIEDD